MPASDDEKENTCNTGSEIAVNSIGTKLKDKTYSYFSDNRKLK